MDSFALFPTSEDEHISSDSVITETQHPDSSGGSTRTDYFKDAPQSITLETKMASDLPISDPCAVVADVPRRPQTTSNTPTSSQPLHIHSMSSILSDNLDRYPYRQISADPVTVHIQNPHVSQIYSRKIVWIAICIAVLCFSLLVGCFVGWEGRSRVFQDKSNAVDYSARSVSQISEFYAA